MFERRSSRGVSFFVFPEMEQVPGLIHGVSGRESDGHLTDAAACVQVAPGKENFLEALRLPREGLVRLRQVHSDRVIVVENQVSRGDLPMGDGILLLRSGIFGVVRTADCLSILGVIPRLKKLLLLHAGWKGTLRRITEQGFRLLLESTGARPEEVRVAFGPCIRSCCYEVGMDFPGRFAAAGFDAAAVFEGRHLDLPKANRFQLQALGIHDIIDSGACTSCRNDVFYSYRKEGQTGRLWTVAGFR